ncbi:MAG: class I SAM-dependent methyltransferase [Actinocrinis sp.]
MAPADDWHAWHDRYEDPGSWMSRRLAVIQERITHFLDAAPAGDITVLSMCAGQGRDLLGVLADHSRAGDVAALLVELDPRNSAIASERARQLGLSRVEVVTGDAARTAQYQSHAPADLVLACGVFGNISDEDVERTIGHCAALCRPGGATIWTRNRQEPDLVPRICDWFAHSGFTLEFVTEPGDFGVGMHRRTGAPRRLVPGATMFTFVTDRTMAQRGCQ